MTFSPPGSVGPTGTPSRPAAGLPGPEVLGSIASVAVLVLFGAVLLPGVSGSSGTPVVPSPSATVGGPVVIEPSATPTSTHPAWTRDAASLLDVDARLLELADDLAAQLDPPPDRADEIARSLRAVNTRLAFALEAIGRLETAGMPADLADALRDVHTAALEASQATLRASISNVAAYVEGGSTVVEALTDIEALQADLSQAIDGTPAP